VKKTVFKVPVILRLDPKKIEIGWRARSDLGDIHELAESIRELGQIHPIRVVTNGKGKPELIAGFRRVEACKKLGIKVRAEVWPAEQRDNALEAEHLELRRQLAENLKRKDFDALEEGEGLRKLKAIYQELHEETKPGQTGGRGSVRKIDIAKSAKSNAAVPAPRFSLEAAKALGCSTRKVDELLEIGNLPKAYKKKIEAAKTTAERNQVARECITKVRQDRKLENLRKRAEERKQQQLEDLEKGKRPPVILHHGDNKDYLKGKELFEVCLTDPPFDRERSIISHAARASINPKQHKWDKLDVGWVLKVAPMLVPGGQIISFCPAEAIGAYELAFQAAGLEYRQFMIWLKTNPAPAHRDVYPNAVEALVWATKPGKKYYWDDRLQKAGAEAINVFQGSGVPGSAKDRVHPTQKPEWLISKLLHQHANPDLGHRILDPFAGSGTTGVVCKKMGLACTLIEENEEYVKAAKLRLEAV